MSKRRHIVTTVPEHGLKTEEFAMAQTAASRVFGRDRTAGVVFEGSQAGVKDDGTIVYPALASGHQMSKDEVLVGRGFADHETSHKRYTDMRQMRELRDEAKRTDNPLLHGVANAIDDLRVDKLAIRDYSGAQANLEATCDAVLGEFLEFAREHPDQAKDLDVVLPLMITAEGRKRMGYNCDNIDPTLAVLDDETRARVEKYVDIAFTCEDSDVARGTKQVIDTARMVVEAKDEDDKDDEDSGDEPGDGPTGEDGDDEGGKRKGREDDEDEGEGDGDGEQVEGGPENVEPELPKGPPVSMDDLQERAMKRTFEKHIEASEDHYRPYSTRYDSYSRVGGGGLMSEWMNRCANLNHYERVMRDMHGKISTMARKLERALLSTQRRDWQTNLEYGALDPKRLVQAAGGRPNVFRLRDDRKEIDTAISIMIDLSGSMHGRIRLAQQTAFALAMVMEKVGVAYEILGFSNLFFGSTSSSPEYATPGEMNAAVPYEWAKRAMEVYNDSGKHGAFSRFEPLQIYEFKNFDRKLVQEREGMSTIHRCAGGHNSDVEAVRTSGQHLRWRHEGRKILFVLSDGLPECTYSMPRGHQHQMLRNEIGRLGHHGIECVGIGIESTAVSRFYPQYVVINSIDDLAKAAFDQMAKLLVSDRFRVDNADLMAMTGGR